MGKIVCLLCGDPSATVKMSKRDKPYLRCENCESILFTYSDIGAELLAAGMGVGLVENPEGPSSDERKGAEPKIIIDGEVVPASEKRIIDAVSQRMEKKLGSLKDSSKGKQPVRKTGKEDSPWKTWGMA